MDDTLMNLPSDRELTYTVGHEAYYAEAMRESMPEPYLTVGAAYRDGEGCAWEFNVVAGRGMRLEIFCDAFDAFQEIPEFFAALADRGSTTLSEVRFILDKLGARDITPRTLEEDPEAVRRMVPKPGAGR